MQRSRFIKARELNFLKPEKSKAFRKKDKYMGLCRDYGIGFRVVGSGFRA